MGDNNFKTLFDELGMTPEPTETDQCSLTMGAPGDSCLKECQLIMQKAAAKRLEESDAMYLFQYGPASGDGPFKKALATFLSTEYKDTVKESSLYLTTGASQGLYLTASLLFNTGDTVFIEDPTYFIAINLLRDDLGLNVVPVPTDDKGLLVDEFEKLLELHLSSSTNAMTSPKMFRSMLYFIPTYNNPKGGCLPPDRCEKLVALARKFNTLLFCDDVYNILYYEDTIPPRFLTYDKETDPDFQGHVLSCGTFSKLFGPGVRLGWIEASNRIINLFVKSSYSDSGGSKNHLVSGLMTTVLTEGLQAAHIDKLRKKYGSRLAAVIALLKEKLPKTVVVSEPKGGYFIWIELPLWCDAVQLVLMAKEQYNVTFLPGTRCTPTGKYGNCIRISFSYYELEPLLEGVKRLCRAVCQYMTANEPMNNGSIEPVQQEDNVSEPTKSTPAQRLIEALGLEPHTVAGNLKLKYTSKLKLGFIAKRNKQSSTEQDKSLDLPAASSIYMLLQGEEYLSWHTIAADELLFFHEGSPIKVHQISACGDYTCINLGRPLDGHNYQVQIPQRCWYAIELAQKHDGAYGLYSEVISPGFHPDLYESGSKEELIEKFPQHAKIITRLSEK
ncbi:unnamed protein product [Owenia fusiformis]|uniref:Uncharacterized protein n=1 Tax=Owenia fusiformis TaxID=6347 RepID=A0A8J1U0Y2_OWEFU|nr:unnamed protein product [Owenia fusiformis]